VDPVLHLSLSSTWEELRWSKERRVTAAKRHVSENLIGIMKRQFHDLSRSSQYKREGFFENMLLLLLKRI